MPSQEYSVQADVALSPTESANTHKRKAPEDNFADDEEVVCPCNAGPCVLLTSTKPHSEGRKFYRCPRSKEEKQCGFFQWQDQPNEAAKKQANFAHVQEPYQAGWSGNDADSGQAANNIQGPQCHCGLSATEITSPNPGRVFYKCPKSEAEGRCRYFEWQDELGSGQTPPRQRSHPQGSTYGPAGSGKPSQTAHGNSAAGTGGSGVFADDDHFDDDFGLAEAVDATVGEARPAAHNAYGQRSFHPDAQQSMSGQGQATSPGGVQPPEILNCHCGMQCSYIMAKTPKNDGRWFYRCPKGKEEGQCRFFQWADELGQQAPSSAGRNTGGYSGPAAATTSHAAPQYHTYNSPPKPSSAMSGAAASSDVCYKCGQSGHWSRDCPNGGNGGGGGGGGASGACFKCGQEGHWSRDCPNPGSGGRGGGGGRGGPRVAAGSGYVGGGYGGRSVGRNTASKGASGACYKCGQSGHWTSSCPN